MSNKEITKRTGKKGSKRKEEKDKKMLMWSGVVFFMLVIIFFWAISFRGIVLGPGNKDAGEGLNLDVLTDEFYQSFNELNNELEKMNQNDVLTGLEDVDPEKNLESNDSETQKQNSPAPDALVESESREEKSENNEQKQ